MASKPPEITLELSGGSLTIRTDQAIYRVKVQGGGAAGPALPPAQSQAALPAGQELGEDWDALPEAPPPTQVGDREEDYYRELSHDMYHEVGRLARRLSMSIRDVSRNQIDSIDFESAGQQLESAKNQLEDVVKMTESATMKIIDLGENIQEAVDEARRIMQMVNPAKEDGEEPEPVDSEEFEAAQQRLTEGLEELTTYLQGLGDASLDQVVAQAEDLLAQLNQAAEGGGPAAPAPEPEPEPEPEPAPAQRWQFQVDVILQTIYELCTNETVKKHIKAMWDAGESEFDKTTLAPKLDALAPDEPDEDNFLNLNLKEVLKALFQSTSNERFQQVLKKMASTLDQIFLDNNLPVEAMEAPADQAAPAAPKQQAPAKTAEAAAPAQDGVLVPSEVLDQAQALVEQLKQAAGSLATPPEQTDLRELIDQVLQASRDTQACNVVDPQLLAQLDNTVEMIMGSVNGIIEALSFQDLAGQMIYRIVRLLTDFQVQLLAMVVSFGSKLKARETGAAVSPDESDRMAQEEVDRMMHDIKAPRPEAGAAPEEGEAAEEGDEDAVSKLNQDAVNALLEGMGF